MLGGGCGACATAPGGLGVFGIGTQELLVIFLVVLLLFGGKRIPEVARSIGSGLRDFRKAIQDVQREIDLDELTRTPPAQKTPPGAPRTDPPPAAAAGGRDAAAEKSQSPAVASARPPGAETAPASRPEPGAARESKAPRSEDGPRAG
jgi:sec-independent protein translocase protein TatA